VPDVDDDQLAWATGVMRRNGMTATGAPAVHAVQAWSTIWTLPTDAGLLWFKASHAGDGAIEPVLAELVPALVDAPVAVEPAKGWLLTRHGGITVDAYLAAGRQLDLHAACRIVQDYATLQRDTLAQRARLIGLGLPVADPAQAADVALAHATYLSALPDDDPRHLRHADHEAVVRTAPHLQVAGETLAAGPVPLGLDHGDLATRNVFMSRTDAPFRFFDFSDARWAHPFESLAMFVWECARRWRITIGTDVIDMRHPRLRQVFDAYLTCWADVGTPEHLRPLMAHALRLAPLHRTSVWIRILADADTAALAAHGQTPWSWLQDVTRPVRL
jgi:hypothetical protein